MSHNPILYDILFPRKGIQGVHKRLKGGSYEGHFLEISGTIKKSTLLFSSLDL